MSDINLDLDFQDYKPGEGTSSGSAKAPEKVVRIPANQDKQPKERQSDSTLRQVLNSLNNVTDNQGGNSDDITEQLLRLAARQRTKNQQEASNGGWGLSLVSNYFDVTTEDVTRRILWSAVPVRKSGIDIDDLDQQTPLTRNMIDETTVDDENLLSNTGDQVDTLFDHLKVKRRNYSYMERFIQSRPDFYGPFWISTTLIFAVAIFSNLVSFYNHKSMVDQKNTSNTNDTHAMATEFKWHYSMEELSMATSLVMLNVLVVPSILWFYFWFRGCVKYYTLAETICAYGYSLSIFIPLAAILMVQATFIRYAALLIASLSTGIVLAMSFLPIIHTDPNKTSSHFILVLIPIFQVGIAYLLHRIMLQ